VLRWASRPPGAGAFPYTTLFRSSWPGISKDVGSTKDLKPASLICLSRTESPLDGSTGTDSDPRSGHSPLGTGRLRAPLKQKPRRSEEHTSELQSRENLVCRLLLE